MIGCMKSWHWIVLAVVLGTAIAVSVCAWYFGGVSGEVFLVGQNGAARAAPGATIDIYPVEDLRKSIGGYLLSDLSGNKKYLERLEKVAQAEQKGISGEKINSALWLVKHTYCVQFSE